MRRTIALGVITAAAIAAAVTWASWPRSSEREPAKLATGTAAELPRAKAAREAPRAAPVTSLAVPTDAGPREPDSTLKTLPFGPDGLGRSVNERGHPVGPASFLATADGVVVLDQLNRRIVLPDGSSIPLPTASADDIAAAGDGFAVLDRTKSAEVAIVDRQGKVQARIPLAGEGIEDPKDVSRLIVSGDDVLVERDGGGPLLRVGSVSGGASETRTEIEGIPSQGDRYLASAGITDEDEGRAWVTLAKRDATHLWTRELHHSGELTAVGFVDAESDGTVWVVLLAGGSPEEYVNLAVCLDGEAGEVRASFALAVDDPPWSTFRDFSVRDGVGLVAATRDERGVTYASYACP